MSGGEEKRRGSRLPAIAAVVLLALVLLASGGILWLAGSGGGDQGTGLAQIGGPFTLTGGDGKPVSSADFRGKYLLVYFGYTYCPDVCPTTLSAMAGALDRLGAKADRIVPVFITVDPQRDTPAVVKQYAAAFGPRFVGLTGTKQQIASVAKEYRVYYAPHRTGPGPNDYTMDHSSIIYMMGPDGRFIAPIRADQPAAGMATAIAGHMG